MPNTSTPFVVCLGFAIAMLISGRSPVAAQTVTERTPPVASAFGTVTLPIPSVGRILKDTLIDFRHLPSAQSLTWLSVGTAGAILGHSADSPVTSRLARPRLEDPFESGSVIGSLPVQLGGALATYTVGRLTNSSRAVTLGAELVRAQLVAQTIAWGAKYAVRRTRPDGSSLSFPSGHASVSFASATVLEKYFGWKVGVPAFSVASYVAASRIQQKRHYLSDVAFGAAVGVMAGRTVTLGHGGRRLGIAPMASPGGGGIALTWLGRR
jgi:membrane-associated phospholipid phosphatase